MQLAESSFPSDGRGTVKGGLGQGIEMEMTERWPSEPSESLKEAFCFPSPLPRVQAEAFSL